MMYLYFLKLYSWPITVYNKEKVHFLNDINAFLLFLLDNFI